MDDLEIQGLAPRVVEKPWGHEIIFANDRQFDYCGKELVFCRRIWCSYHFHRIKHETFYVADGSLMLEYGHGERPPQPHDPQGRCILHQGMRFRIPIGLHHRMRSIGEQARLIEVSTFDDPADSYRLTASGLRAAIGERYVVQSVSDTNLAA